MESWHVMFECFSNAKLRWRSFARAALSVIDCTQIACIANDEIDSKIEILLLFFYAICLISWWALIVSMFKVLRLSCLDVVLMQYDLCFEWAGWTISQSVLWWKRIKVSLIKVKDLLTGHPSHLFSRSIPEKHAQHPYPWEAEYNHAP